MTDEKPQYLKHGESFVRARRNYMLSTVTIIVLAVANPATIKVPGLGEDATLPATLAFLALWLAMAYFAWEYRAEHAFVSMMNSSAAERADAEDQALLTQMRQRIETLSAGVIQIADMRVIEAAQLDPEWHLKLDEEAVGGIKGALAQAVRMAEQTITGSMMPGECDPKIFEKAAASFNSMVDQKVKELTEYYESHRTQLNMQVSKIGSEVSPQLPVIEQRLREASAALTALDATYRNVSTRVHATLRNAFRWKDTCLAAALGVIATLMLIVPLAGYQWAWHDWSNKTHDARFSDTVKIVTKACK